MKITTLTLLLTVSCIVSSYAQDIQNQTEELANIKVGMYTAYLTHKDAGEYIGGINDLHHEVTDIKDYRLNPGTHKEVYLIENKDPNRPNDLVPEMLVPDNEAFPVTYIRAAYEGNKQLMEEIGYTVRETGDYGETRVVFLDGKIYFMEDWVDKDNYTLKAVLEHTEKPLKGLKLVKAVYGTRKKMNNDQPDATLQEYLDQATAKQEQVYATWSQDPGNAAFIAEKGRIAQAMADYIRNDREEYFQSEEYQRIVANNQRADAAASRSNVTVYNNTGQTVYISGANAGGWTRISPNSSTSYSCDYDIYYNYEGKGDGVKFYSANASCGGTVNIQ
ncbi:MAG: hypothetical protein AAFO69_19320 [Bacteroidota bacterium]